MRKIFFAIIFCFIFFIDSFSQIPIGAWRDHFSFINVFSVAQLNDDRLAAASENGLIFINNDGSVEKLTKANGLFDVGVSAMLYSENSDKILIGYENGNIDIIEQNNVFNLSDIKRKNIATDKKIYSFFQNQGFIYCATGFGIVKFDTENNEIADTYYIGDNATFVKVNDITIINDSIFAATDQGLFTANTNDFLADFNYWNKIQYNNYSGFSDIINIQNTLFLIAYDQNNDYFLMKRNSDYSLEKIASNLNTDSKLFFKENLYLTKSHKIVVFNSNGKKLSEIKQIADNDNLYPAFVGFKNNGELLIGDEKNGFYVENNSNYENYFYSGVFLNEAMRIKAAENFVVVTRGGYKSTGVNLWKKATVNLFYDDQWSFFQQENANDFHYILIDENKTGHFYIGSWGYGVFEYQYDELLNFYNYKNSPLETVIANDPYCRISGLHLDEQNNLWIINRAENKPLNVLKNDGNWVSFNLNYVIADEVTGDMKITEDNLLWAIIKGRGFLVLDYNNTIENQNDDINKVFYPYDENGERIGSNVYCFIEDKEGEIWFGTDEGVGVIYSPLNFQENNFYASRIKITAELSDSLTTNYLLGTEKVLSVAVDGGNRKWFGTENSGAYLTNSTGTKELLHFDSDNSPLPSDKVLSVDIEPQSGEVFFVTSKGVVSYRADATEANDKFGDVYVFPNPVRPDYTGIITITGLAENVNVKITDIEGNIVFETTANGGQATWDGKNFDGKRAATGVYLVFCSNDDGSETFITKLLFIN